jgi:hypothetical protein
MVTDRLQSFLVILKLPEPETINGLSNLSEGSQMDNRAKSGRIILDVRREMSRLNNVLIPVCKPAGTTDLSALAGFLNINLACLIPSFVSLAGRHQPHG